MDIKTVETSYARWAPVYDRTFGAVTRTGRRRTVDFINRTLSCGDRVLEVGVGTGLALEFYRPELRVTGIDFSTEMLAQARAKVTQLQLTQVEELRQMDARALDFPDAQFDTVAAMHVLSVVPEPERVMAEIARVCKPGGRVVITNHFMRTEGPLAMLERVSAPFANVLGWHSDFAIETVLGEDVLEIEQQTSLPPLGMMTFLVLRKRMG
ncbi:class I SAM-dependent methyltransferase [Pseudodonghicola flavimaris]|uniref:Methyltransferase domain-containing protein n=1 Tax=Pseudodonghicola flavimaris TaxID=3050036 RepID=A0ABT7EZG1_9RHOB|nr:methyltransferase domain-containing protein [Pseudodonghicola flavimaris]MDK3017746.1 methyltransferase domain-containing protein [Pseudodonghicola flavimaris]